MSSFWSTVIVCLSNVSPEQSPARHFGHRCAVPRTLFLIELKPTLRFQHSLRTKPFSKLLFESSVKEPEAQGLRPSCGPTPSIRPLGLTASASAPVSLRIGLEDLKYETISL